MEVNKEELRRLAERAAKGVMKVSPADWFGFREMSGNPAVILSLLDENKALLDQVVALQSDSNSWQSGYDKGREMGGKHRASEVDQLRSENERLKQELAARHPFRPAQPVPVLGHTGCVICGAFTDHGGLQCPKLRPSCVSQ